MASNGHFLMVFVGNLWRLTIILEPLHFVFCALCYLIGYFFMFLPCNRYGWQWEKLLFLRDPLTLGIFRLVFWLLSQMREWVYTFFHSIWPNSLLKLRFVTFKLRIFQCILHYKNLNLNVTNLNLNSEFGHIEWRKVYLQICCDLLILSPHGKDLVPLFCLMHLSQTSGLEEYDHICHYQPLVASMMFQNVIAVTQRTANMWQLFPQPSGLHHKKVLHKQARPEYHTLKYGNHVCFRGWKMPPWASSSKMWF